MPSLAMLPTAHVLKSARHGIPFRSQFRALVRPGGSSGNCARGAWWLRAGQRSGSPAWTCFGQVERTKKRQPGFRCHGGQKRRQPVRLNLPSGLLNGEPKLSRWRSSFSRKNLFPAESEANSKAKSGPDFRTEIKALPIASQMPKSESVSEPKLRVSPCLLGRSPFISGSEKSALGCLTYSRIWGLSREKHHIR